MKDSSPEDIIEFWFGFKSDIRAIIAEKSMLWWSKNENVDDEIRERFGDLHSKLEGNGFSFWTQQPGSYLAVIILADQFSRNIYRNSPRAYATDEFALSLALDGIEYGVDKELRWIERVFFYMPLEHSESLKIQEKSVILFQKLQDNVPAIDRDSAVQYTDHALAHQKIINRFGRFPHRNEVLGRESTHEEVEFLKQPGSSF